MTAAESARPALEGVGAGRVVAAAPMGSVSSGRVCERVAVPWVRQTCRASRVEESGLFLVKNSSGSIHIHSFTTHTLSMAMRDVDEQRRHRGYGQQANLERDQSISIMTTYVVDTYTI